jgi:hypothetical protein
VVQAEIRVTQQYVIAAYERIKRRLCGYPLTCGGSSRGRRLAGQGKGRYLDRGEPDLMSIAQNERAAIDDTVDSCVCDYLAPTRNAAADVLRGSAATITRCCDCSA